MNDILLNGIIGVVSSLTTWLLARRKYHAEVGNTVISNMEKSLQFYMKLSDDNKNRLNEMQEKLDQELSKNASLKGELETLKLQVQFLLRFNCMRNGCKKRITNSMQEEIDRDNI